MQRYIAYLELCAFAQQKFNSEHSILANIPGEELIPEVDNDEEKSSESSESQLNIDATQAYPIPDGWMLDNVMSDFLLTIGRLSCEVTPEESLPIDAKIGFYLFYHENLNQYALVVCGNDMSEHFESTVVTDYCDIIFQLYNRFSSDFMRYNHYVNSKERNSFVILGYGLGGVLPQLLFFEFDDYVNEVITFESPGTETLVERLRERFNHFDFAPSDSGYENQSRIKLHENPRITHFVTRPNIVNTVDIHQGYLFRLVMPHTETWSLSHIGWCAFELISFGITVGSMASAMSNLIASNTVRNELIKDTNKWLLSDEALEYFGKTINNARKLTKNEAAELAKNIADGLMDEIKNALPRQYELVELRDLLDAFKGPERHDLLIELSKKANNMLNFAAASDLSPKIIDKIYSVIMKHKELAYNNQHVISRLLSFVKAFPFDASNIRHIFNWPCSTKPRDDTWGEFALGFVFPRRGVYIVHENAYLENQLVRRVPGYQEAENQDGVDNLLGTFLSFQLPEASLSQAENIVTPNNFKNINLSMDGAFRLLANLRLYPTYSNLEHLNLSENALEDDVIHTLSAFIEELPNLETLSLENNHITENSLAHILETTTNHPTLSCVNLSSNWIFFSLTLLNSLDRNNAENDDDDIDNELDMLFSLPMLLSYYLSSAQEEEELPEKQVTIDISGNNFYFFDRGRDVDFDELSRKEAQLMRSIHQHSLFTTSLGNVDSLISGCNIQLDEDSALVFVVADNVPNPMLNLNQQHASLFIEKLNLDGQRCFYKFDLTAHNNQATIQFKFASQDELFRFKNNDYVFYVEKISLSKGNTLLTRLKNALNREYLYSKAPSRSSNAEEEQFNCISWITKQVTSPGVRMSFDPTNSLLPGSELIPTQAVINANKNQQNAAEEKDNTPSSWSFAWYGNTR